MKVNEDGSKLWLNDKNKVEWENFKGKVLMYSYIRKDKPFEPNDKLVYEDELGKYYLSNSTCSITKKPI